MTDKAKIEPGRTPGEGYWDPEDASFWESAGKHIASRNLWISVPCLLCAFGVWSYWSIITVQMKNLDFPFTSSQLFTLTAVAGLTGATLRIPNAFLIAIAGGRNVIAVSTALLLAPALGAGIALGDLNTPYATFVILAALSGFGGGTSPRRCRTSASFFRNGFKGRRSALMPGWATWASASCRWRCRSR